MSGQLGLIPWGEGFLLLFIVWFISIHTRRSHPLGIGHSSSGESKGCCLGGLCYLSNTLHVCTTPQKHHSISLLYEYDHIAEVLRKTAVQLGIVLLIENTLASIDPLIKLI